MRLVKLQPCTYSQYETIRDVIYRNIPFAVINIDFSAAEEMAIFNFWDSDYIPDELKPFIMQPPLSRENKAKMSKELSEVILGSTF